MYIGILRNQKDFILWQRYQVYLCRGGDRQSPSASAQQLRKIERTPSGRDGVHFTEPVNRIPCIPPGYLRAGEIPEDGFLILFEQIQHLPVDLAFQILQFALLLEFLSLQCLKPGGDRKSTRLNSSHVAIS